MVLASFCFFQYLDSAYASRAALVGSIARTSEHGAHHRDTSNDTVFSMAFLESSSVRLRACCWTLLLVLPCRATAEITDPPTGDSARAGIAFISDIQAPIFFERLVLPSDRNTEATRALLHDILRKRPARVFLLGDLTSMGFHESAWETIDAFLDSLRAVRTGADAVLGNHEFLLYPSQGAMQFMSRFPDASRIGSVRSVDSLAVVMLNSNFDHLSPEQRLAQQAWYQRTLDSLDGAPSVRAVIVCCHHSPYTNSTLVGTSITVQQRFVPGFVAARKARLFLSGHAHAFEHFQRSGKDFLVIGGGGGLLHPLAEGAGKLEGDLAPVPRPRFHYIMVERSGAHLVVAIQALQDDHATVMRIPCPLAPGDSSAAE